MTQENSAQAIIDLLKLDAERVPQPAKSIIYTLIADMYKSHYQNNRWQISERTRISVVGDDINTWDISRLFEEAVKYYNLSIADEKSLQQTQLSDYNELIIYSEKRDEKAPVLLPTLYDFLVFKMINAYKSELNVVIPQQTFVLNNPKFFAETRTFVDLKIESPDTLSVEYQVITLYQKLIKFRLQQLAIHSSSVDNQYALVNLDIERLKYLHENGRYSNADKLYEDALKSLIDSNYNSSVWDYPAYALANLYKKQGANKNEEHRNKLKEAYNLYGQIISKNKTNEIVKLALEMQEQIKNPSLQLALSNQQIPLTPILALVDYKNITKAYLHIYKVNDEDALTFNSKYYLF